MSELNHLDKDGLIAYYMDKANSLMVGYNWFKNHCEELDKEVARLKEQASKPHTVELDADPCPSCGGDAEVFEEIRGTCGHGETADVVGIRCKSCGLKKELEDYAGYRTFERKVRCLARWNRW